MPIGENGLAGTNSTLLTRAVRTSGKRPGFTRQIYALEDVTKPNERGSSGLLVRNRRGARGCYRVEISLVPDAHKASEALLGMIGIVNR